MTTVSTLHHVRLDAADTRTLASGAAAAVQQAAIFRIEGPGAVGCLQGIVSNDVQKRGPGTICYGAVLTPKGMIIFDCWLLRDGDTIVLVADLSVRQTALDIFRRQLPPRIAKAADLSDSHRWLTVLGATARQTGIDAGMPATPGQLTRSADEVLLAQAPLTAPFGCCAVGETAAINELAATMPAASPRSAPRSTRRRCRRKSASTSTPASATTRGATRARKRWRACISGGIRTANSGCSWCPTA